MNIEFLEKLQVATDVLNQKAQTIEHIEWDDCYLVYTRT